MHAARKGNVEIAELLINSKANIEAKSKVYSWECICVCVCMRICVYVHVYVYVNVYVHVHLQGLLWEWRGGCACA